MSGPLPGRTVTLVSKGCPYTFTPDFFEGRYETNDSGCWIWTGCLSVRRTRARFAWKKGGMYAYRISYEVFVGPIPDGKQINHHCDDGRCINPAHIYAGTQRQNARDAIRRNRLVPPAPRRGDDNPQAHPSEIYDEVRRLVAEKRTPKAEIARRFGIGVGTVRSWARGERVGEDGVPYIDERLKPRAPCGTRAGYCTHQRRGESPCRPCKDANTNYLRAYKATRKAKLRSAAA